MARLFVSCLVLAALMTSETALPFDSVTKTAVATLAMRLVEQGKLTFDDHLMWGHTGDGIGSHTEFWHLVKENVTIAVTWNDDIIEGDGGIFPGLVRAAV